MKKDNIWLNEVIQIVHKTTAPQLDKLFYAVFRFLVDDH